MKFSDFARLSFKFVFFNLFYRIDKFMLDISRKYYFEGKNILDIGAERSPYRKNFSRGRYQTLDVAQNAQKNIDFICDINEGMPEVPNQKFDYIICTQVLEHIRNVPLVFQEFNRVLKPGGKVFLTTNFCYEEHMVPNDYFRFTRYGLAYLGESNGFRVRHLEPHGGIFQVLAYVIVRIPIQLFTGRDSLLYYAYLVIFSIPIAVLNLVCYLLDFLDREKSLTLNYEVIYEKDRLVFREGQNVVK